MHSQFHMKARQIDPGDDLVIELQDGTMITITVTHFKGDPGYPSLWINVEPNYSMPVHVAVNEDEVYC